jgi:uncharacterized protein (DUF1697 family)
MTPRIALLRGINVGGRMAVAMADLRALLGAQGWTNPRTLLQSGNAVFEAEGTDREIEGQLEKAVAARFGLAIDVMLRDSHAWGRMIAANPFAEAAKDDPSHLLAVVLKEAPVAQAVDDLRAAIKGPEQIDVQGTIAYIVYPNGIGRSALTNALIESRLKTRGTGRNWNTVLKLADLAAG